MAVKVILRQDVPEVGNAGDIKEVAPGYFRNYLLPRGLAVEASKGRLAALNVDASLRDKQSSRAKDQVNAVAAHMQEKSVVIPVKLGEQGRIYGSVTNKDIAEQMLSQLGIQVDRHKIELRDPLKALGEHSVPVKLEHGVEARVRVELVADTGDMQA